MQEINIEAIMQEIREDIRKKGYTSDILSFQDMPVSGAEGYSYSYEELERLVYQVNKSCSVAWKRELSGNLLVAFIKDVIYKLMTFLIAPMSDEQNLFNSNVTRVINQLMGYINVQNDKIENLEKDIEILEEKVAHLIENRGE